MAWFGNMTCMMREKAGLAVSEFGACVSRLASVFFSQYSLGSKSKATCINVSIGIWFLPFSLIDSVSFAALEVTLVVK